ncbi:MAG: RdgB/HAM1 family non-canonical purine NTP pyrophosphatase [Pirellulaceae bacterium]
MEIVVGSHNQKKIKELRDVFTGVGIKLLSLEQFTNAIEVDETGTTFAENAKLKASQQAHVLKRWVLAEDSGLSVEALKGAPGVYSARYAGDPRDDNRNNAKLLEDLKNVPLDKRHAWYTCHMALSDPDGIIIFDCVGECHGRIINDYSGEQGFGYDPLFEVVEYHQTFGQLGLSVKSLISHRARAAREFLRRFRQLNLG